MVRPARPSLVACFLSLFLVTSGVVSACGGSEFSGQATGGGSGNSAAGAIGVAGDGSGGSGAGVGKGGTVLCSGHADCDDGDLCTVDECDADGHCQHSAKCDAGERCCDTACRV